ncbi:hypothetical protein SRABI106_02810 [Rahnella aquatilis]|nr:hypothetical protein SRABI106_02810 [Rahnella aquatilis]
MILLFGREGIARQPFEQLLAVRADHFGLRIVNMRIDKARDDQLVAIIINFQNSGFTCLRQLALTFLPASQPDDCAAAEQHQAVFDITHLRF